MPGQGLLSLRAELKKYADPARAKVSRSFFKTGKGEYGEGDVFLGIIVPTQRLVAKKYADALTLQDLDKLIKSKIHEERLIALLILVDQFQKSNRLAGGLKLKSSTNLKKSVLDKSKIYKFYLSHTKNINNWDLVDLSAPKIVGAYLRDKDTSVLYKLAKSKDIWEKRIAILSTFDFIYQGQYRHTVEISKLLLNDTHDLIHKAVGWMLREMGKHGGEKHLTDFLNAYAKIMPRTMLRYAIERLPEGKRQYYLKR